MGQSCQSLLSPAATADWVSPRPGLWPAPAAASSSPAETPAKPRRPPTHCAAKASTSRPPRWTSPRRPASPPPSNTSSRTRVASTYWSTTPGSSPRPPTPPSTRSPACRCSRRPSRPTSSESWPLPTRSCRSCSRARWDGSSTCPPPWAQGHLGMPRLRPDRPHPHQPRPGPAHRRPGRPDRRHRSHPPCRRTLGHLHRLERTCPLVNHHLSPGTATGIMASRRGATRQQHRPPRPPVAGCPARAPARPRRRGWTAARAGCAGCRPGRR